MDIDVETEAPPATQEEGGLTAGQINGLVLFARDVLRSTADGALCQHTAFEAALEYGLTRESADHVCGFNFSDWMVPVIEMFDAFERDHLESEELADSEQSEV